MVDFRLKVSHPIQFSYNNEQLRYQSKTQGRFLSWLINSLYKYTTNYKYN